MIVLAGICLSIPHAYQAAGVGKKAPVPTLPGSLDQTRIHGIYNEGDFDRVVALIDSFTRIHKTYPVADSVFIAKHLAVVYTANPATREKGKGYMFRLLEMLPSAKIVDMFVSDEIDRIFDKIREEYVVRQRYLGREEDPIVEKAVPADTAVTVKKTSLHPAYWLAGGVALAAISGATIFYFNSDESKDKVYGFPSK